MKNIFALAMIATAAVSAISMTAPAFADHEDRAREDAHDSHVERHEAVRQEEKAQRDAARGNVAGAERHAAEARQDAHEAHHDAHKARRQAEKAY